MTNEFIIIKDNDREWLKQIFIAMTSQTMTDDTIQLAMELAFKRGFEKGKDSWTATPGTNGARAE